MKRWVLLGCLLPMLGLATPLESTKRKNVFGPGEQTTFEVSLLGVMAGTAQVTVGWQMEHYGKTVWPLVCTGQTAGVASPIKLKDKFVAYFDPEQQRSIGADFFTHEGDSRRRERYRYDRSVNQAFAHKQWNADPAYEKVYDISPDAMDLAGAGFAIRNRQLEVGQVHELPIFTGGAQYLMKAVVERTEEITTKLGTFKALVIKVNGDFSGKLKTSADMTMYMSADERHLPLRLRADFAVGSVVIDAVKYEPGRSVSE